VSQLLDLLTLTEVLSLQLLCKQMHEKLVPLYCENRECSRPGLYAFRAPETVQKDAMLLFQKDAAGSFFKISARDNKLRWHRSCAPLVEQKDKIFKK